MPAPYWTPKADRLADILDAEIEDAVAEVTAADGTVDPELTELAKEAA